LNQQNALIKEQQNITQDTRHVRYQLLQISATCFHPQGNKNNKRFVSPKRVVVVVIAVIVVLLIVVVIVVVVIVVTTVVTIKVVLVIAIAVVIVAVTVEVSPA
jgi:hypothetical protein